MRLDGAGQAGAGAAARGADVRRAGPARPSAGASVMITRLTIMRRLRIRSAARPRPGPEDRVLAGAHLKLRIASRIRKPPSAVSDHRHRARAGPAFDRSVIASLVLALVLVLCRRAAGAAGAGADRGGRRGGATGCGGCGRDQPAAAERPVGGLPRAAAAPALRLPVDAHGVPDHLRAHLDRWRLLRGVLAVASPCGAPAAKPARPPSATSARAAA